MQTLKLSRSEWMIHLPAVQGGEVSLVITLSGGPSPIILPSLSITTRSATPQGVVQESGWLDEGIAPHLAQSMSPLQEL